MRHPAAPCRPAGRLLLTCACTLGALAGGAAQAADTVDQFNTGPVAGGFTLNAGPIGQGFTPALSALDFVELQINDQNPGDGQGALIAVRIRAGGIAGAVVGTSQTVAFADQAPLPFQAPERVRFSFTTPVALTPGATYVIEPFRAAPGGSDLGVFGTGFGIDAYASGVSYFRGAVFDDREGAPFDLWFSEGVAAVPEPSAALLLLAGLPLLWWRHARRAA